MGDLVHLVDEHTEYFKSHLDALPAVERKVYLALAEIAEQPLITADRRLYNAVHEHLDWVQWVGDYR